MTLLPASSTLVRVSRSFRDQATREFSAPEFFAVTTLENLQEVAQVRYGQAVRRVAQELGQDGVVATLYQGDVCFYVELSK